MNQTPQQPEPEKDTQDPSWDPEVLSNAPLKEKPKIIAQRIWANAKKGHEGAQTVVGCLGCLGLLAIVGLIAGLTDLLFIHDNKYGVPEEIVAAIQHDLELNSQRYEATLSNCDYVIWFENEISPTNSGDSSLPNKYTVEAIAVGNKNALGTRQEATVNLRYKWDPSSESVVMYDIDVYSEGFR